MAGRKRSDSLHVKSELYDLTDISPPDGEELPPEVMPYWYAITRARVKESWTVVDLHHACNLAKAQCNIARLQAEVELEGDVVKGARGTPVLNPKHVLIGSLVKRSVALSRHIQVHAVATVGEADKQRGKKTVVQSKHVQKQKKHCLMTCWQDLVNDDTWRKGNSVY